MRRSEPIRRRRPRRPPRAAGHRVERRADWQTLSELLWARCDGHCEACGGVLRRPHQPYCDRHHRLHRPFGEDAPTNLVMLHPDCHTVAPQAVHMRPTWARSRGLIVPSWSDPATTGLWLPDGRLVQLTDDGNYRVIMEGEGLG